MYTPALLFRSLRISTSSLPPPTSLPPLFTSSSQAARSFSVSSPSTSSSLPPPTPYYTSRPKRTLRSTVPSPSALEWSSDPAANAHIEFAHLAPVAPDMSSEREKANLELAERFPEKIDRKEVAEVVEVDPSHLYTAPPPLHSSTSTASSPLLTQHFRTFLSHQKNLLTLHLPLPLSTYKWSKETNPNQQAALRLQRYQAKLAIWDLIASGGIEELSFDEAKALVLKKRTASTVRNKKRRARKEGAPEPEWLSDAQWAEEMEDRRREKEEGERRRVERMGIEREGFRKGGKERIFLEKYLGGEPKKDGEGKGREPKIGRKRKVH
ncbi:hypothetical protein BDY24DRAFT_106670 [Mrakia frigida]|uniref:uncharacterized protein n=1 Tax=Mrakia frigida TaxID=29902 RepID=UPI003FCBF2C9